MRSFCPLSCLPVLSKSQCYWGDVSDGTRRKLASPRLQDFILAGWRLPCPACVSLQSRHPLLTVSSCPVLSSLLDTRLARNRAPLAPRRMGRLDCSLQNLALKLLPPPFLFPEKSGLYPGSNSFQALLPNPLSNLSLPGMPLIWLEGSGIGFIKNGQFLKPASTTRDIS